MSFGTIDSIVVDVFGQLSVSERIDPVLLARQRIHLALCKALDGKDTITCRLSSLGARYVGFDWYKRRGQIMQHTSSSILCTTDNS